MSITVGELHHGRTVAHTHATADMLWAGEFQYTIHNIVVIYEALSCFLYFVVDNAQLSRNIDQRDFLVFDFLLESVYVIVK